LRLDRCRNQEGETKDTKKRLAQKQDDKNKEGKKCNAKYQNRKFRALDTLSLMRRKVCESPIIPENALNMNCSSCKVVIYVQISELSIKGGVPSCENENSSQNSLEKNSESGKYEETRHLTTKLLKPLGHKHHKQTSTLK